MPQNAITHTVGNRSPSLTDTISVDNVPFNLTGSTVTFSMRPEDSAVAKVNAAAAVVVNALAGTVRYDWVNADVDTAGEFNGWWTVTLANGKTQDTLEFPITFFAHAPLGRSLCELEDVTDFAPGYKSDATTDATLEALIAAKSREWHQQAAREFKPVTPAVNPRRFDLAYCNISTRLMRIGDLSAAPTSVSLYDTDQVTLVQTIASPDYVLVPRIREEWQPVTGLFFPTKSANTAQLVAGRVIEVNGTWGFPSVPADVRQAVAGMVIYDYMTKVAETGTAFSEAINYGAVNVGALFARGQMVLESYAVPQVG